MNEETQTYRTVAGEEVEAKSVKETEHGTLLTTIEGAFYVIVDELAAVLPLDPEKHPKLAKIAGLIEDIAAEAEAASKSDAEAKAEMDAEDEATEKAVEEAETEGTAVDEDSGEPLMNEDGLPATETAPPDPGTGHNDDLDGGLLPPPSDEPEPTSGPQPNDDAEGGITEEPIG